MNNNTEDIPNLKNDMNIKFHIVKDPYGFDDDYYCADIILNFNLFKRRYSYLNYSNRIHFNKFNESIKVDNHGEINKLSVYSKQDEISEFEIFLNDIQEKIFKYINQINKGKKFLNKFINEEELKF